MLFYLNNYTNDDLITLLIVDVNEFRLKMLLYYRFSFSSETPTVVTAFVTLFLYLLLAVNVCH